MFTDLPDCVPLHVFQTTVFVMSMIFLAIGLWVGHALGKDNWIKRDRKGRFVKP